MDNLRSVLNIVLSKIPTSLILSSEVQYDNITRETFVKIAGYYLKHYSNDELDSLFNYITPVYNFINDRFVDESAVLRPLSWHLILYVFRYFSRKWQTISDCECPDLIQNETPVRFLYGTQKNVRSDRAESSWRSN